MTHHRSRNSTRRLVMLALFIAASAIGLLSGCTHQDAAALRAEADAAQHTLARLRAETLERAAAAPDDAARLHAEQTLAAIDAAARRLAQITASINPDGSISAEGIGAVGAALPPPWNVLLGVGATVLVGIVQERRKRQAVTDLVDYVADLSRKSAPVKAAVLENIEIARANLDNPEWRRIEEAVRA